MALYVCASNSSDFFVAAYKLAGESVISVSLNGTFVFNPYTELEEAKITLGINGRCLTTTSMSDTKPATLEWTYACGFFAAYRTPACAARCSTWVNVHRENISASVS